VTKKLEAFQLYFVTKLYHIKSSPFFKKLHDDEQELSVSKPNGDILSRGAASPGVRGVATTPRREEHAPQREQHAKGEQQSQGKAAYPGGAA
jgi:hypothetical protein